MLFGWLRDRFSQKATKPEKIERVFVSETGDGFSKFGCSNLSAVKDADSFDEVFTAIVKEIEDLFSLGEISEPQRLKLIRMVLENDPDDPLPGTEEEFRNYFSAYAGASLTEDDEDWWELTWEERQKRLQASVDRINAMQMEYKHRRLEHEKSKQEAIEQKLEKKKEVVQERKPERKLVRRRRPRIRNNERGGRSR